MSSRFFLLFVLFLQLELIFCLIKFYILLYSRQAPRKIINEKLVHVKQTSNEKFLKHINNMMKFPVIKEEHHIKRLPELPYGDVMSMETLNEYDKIHYDPAKIGCQFKKMLEIYIEMYNQVYYNRGKPSISIDFEGCFQNATFFKKSSINRKSYNKFSCLEFYNIFSCMQKQTDTFMKYANTVGPIFKNCEDPKANSTEDRQKCMLKCYNRNLKFFNGQVFNSTKAADWHGRNLPGLYGTASKNAIESCYIKSIGDNPALDCKYFYDFYNCQYITFTDYIDKTLHIPETNEYFF